MRYEGVAAKLARFPELDRPAIWVGLEILEHAFLIDAARRRKEQEGSNRGR
jgi:hypothetical protein